MAEISSARKHSLIEKVKKDGQERKRIILHLILGYLKDNGFQKSVESIKQEACIGQMYEVCENVDLDIILQEYQSYYFTKFQRSPKIIKKQETEEHTRPERMKKRSSLTISRKESVKQNNLGNGAPVFPVEVLHLSPDEKSYSETPIVEQIPPQFSLSEIYSGEWKEFAEAIQKEIITETSCTFADCIGLDNAIECVKEATVYPLQYPELFQNMQESWNGVLLYGPPGTGKTLLAKAVASETNCTFINLTNSAFISKWRGESEKMLKVLFEMAKYYAPTVIFIDELDSVIAEGSHEASKRFKCEMLVQMDGITKTTHPIFVLATTNHPWALEKATLRRFEKKIFIDLPNERNRNKLFSYYLKKYGGNLTKEEIDALSKKTIRFTGHDIKTLCKEARMSIIREQIKNKSSTNQISFDAMKNSLIKIKCGTSEEDIKKYRDWSKEFGST
ncbi:katanin p60 ATPase-containing subunit A-like 2 [Aethina tumida]|uniref:katanin p60 ATPase-containing subunit A-like 2 n=1 Tax=Aethina tumida TaxID=116153 RepID=UPI0021488F02|nr:katanin p60 ATPase-containing subunit A-like 2 [Aethina tumida]